MNRPAITRFARCIGRDCINVAIAARGFVLLVGEQVRRLWWHVRGLVRSLFQK